MEEWFHLSEEEALGRLEAARYGLSSREAAVRKEEFGPNALRAGEKRSALQVFLDQFKDLLVIILIIAAVISMISGDVESTAVIFAVLLLNAVLGTVEHQKAEKSLDSLKSLSAPMAGVLRDGRRQGRFRLYQLAYRLTEGDNLLGALRGIHVDGVVDLIVLFLSHGNGYCVKRIVFPQGRRL